MDWSFSGCGFLGVYHVGVASCLKEYAPHLVGKIYGASGGALAGCCLICNCCLGQAIGSLLSIAAKARSRSLGPLHPSFNITKVIRNGLNKVLPPNAHEIASGRLFISLTRVSDSKNVVISEFASKEDLMQLLICSSFIPIYCGIIPPSFQGVRYLDGGITDNQPIFDDNTITISPFAGETDICPLDNSHSFISFSITNSNIQLNANNIHRLFYALFPPSAEILSDMCKQGFEDTLRFLQRKSLISCIRCLSFKTNVKLADRDQKLLKNQAERYFAYMAKNEKSLLPTKKDKNTGKIKHSNGKCVECKIPLCTNEMKNNGYCDHQNYKIEETFTNDISNLLINESFNQEDFERIKKLPPAISEAFKAACKKMDNGLLNFILKLPPMKLFAYYVYICLFPMDMFLHLALRFLDWIPYLPGDMAWIFSHFVPLLRLFLKKICDQKPEAKASLTCEIAVSQETYYDDYKASLKAGEIDKINAHATIFGDPKIIDKMDEKFYYDISCRNTTQPPPFVSLKCELSSNLINDPSMLTIASFEGEPSHDVINGSVSKNELLRRASWYGREYTPKKSQTKSSHPSLLRELKTKRNVGCSTHHYSSFPCLMLSEKATPSFSHYECSLKGLEMENFLAHKNNAKFSSIPHIINNSASDLSLNDIKLPQKDAVMSYYYLDDNDGKVKITEIYDISNMNENYKISNQDIISKDFE